MKENKKYVFKNFILIYVVIIFAFPFLSFAQYIDQSQSAEATPLHVPGEVIVKFKDSSLKLNTKLQTGEMISASVKTEAIYQAASILEEEEDLVLKDTLTPGRLGLYKTKEGESVEVLIERLKKNPNVEYAEPNYIYQSAAINTDDTYKDNLWGLDNTGQSVNGTVGILDKDIDAPEAWAINEGTNASIIAAVVDVGVAYNHPDLINNMWDGANCVDENGIFLGGCEHGYNYVNNTKIPLPNGDGHGTHIAGTIGATKNNGMGIIGVAPNVKIMALSTNYNLFSVVKGIDFATQNGAKVINASYGGLTSISHFYAVKRFTNAGGIFIAAAMNWSRNNDITPTSPSSDNIDEIISIAATGQSDTLAGFSDWGLKSVDIAAPGVNIYSTICSSDCNSQSYGYMNGTSMATPHVVGLAALIWGTNPNLTNLGVKNIILSSGDFVPSLSTKILTGKRVNANNALLALNSLSSYIPVGGYVVDNIIPANQINYASDTGLITVNFKVKDLYPGLTEQLSDFSYSTDGGVTWQVPVGGDSSLALPESWSKNNYISSTDYNGSAYNFIFDSRNIESIGINNIISSDTKIRFKVTNGINTSDYMVSEDFSVNNFIQKINILDPLTTLNVNADNYNIIGSTNAGSLVEIYNGIDIVGSLQLDPTDIDFNINVILNQNSINNFTVKATEPIYGTIKIVTIYSINESNNLYSYGWTQRINSGNNYWASMASSSDGKKIVAAESYYNGPTPGYIYTSVDSGLNWVKRINAGLRNWSSVSSSSDGTKLAATIGGDNNNHEGYIYTSIDGGETWVEQTSSGIHAWNSITSSSDGTKLAATFFDIYFDNIWGNFITSSYVSTSNDSGATWVKRISAGQDYYYWKSVTSSSDGTKLAAAINGGYIYTSNNGGLTWVEQKNSGSRNWQSITSSSDGTKLAAVVNGGYVYTSTDSGATWVERQSSGLLNWYSITSSSDGTKLAAVDGGYTSTGYVYISNDSGLTWVPQTNIGLRNWVSVDISSDGLSVVTGSSFSDYIYTYGLIEIPNTKTQTASINNNTVILSAITDTNSTSRGFEYGFDTSYGNIKNENGIFEHGLFTVTFNILQGATYHYRSYVTNSIGTSYSEDSVFKSMSFVEKNNSGQKNWQSIASSSDGVKLAAVVNGGYIYTSTDSGSTWVERQSSGQRDWYSIASSSDGVKLAAVVNGGYIYTSTDSGSTWVERQSSGQRDWYSIASSSDGVKLAAITDSIYVYLSLDSGLNWIEKNNNTFQGRSIASSSDGSILILGESSFSNHGYVYISIDGGNTWTKKMNEKNKFWLSVASSSDGTKLAAADRGGYIYTSSDSGATWVEQISSNSYLWSSIASSSDGTKLAAVVNGGYAYTYTAPDNRPICTSVSISGSISAGGTLEGQYNYSDMEGDLEGTSVYRWFRDDVVINGANSLSYNILPIDLGKTIKFEVTPIALTGTIVGLSKKSIGVTIENSLPVVSNLLISGSLTVGNTLTGSYTYTDIDGDLEGTSTYKWLRDDIEIPSATSLTYITTIDDINKTIKFEVTPISLTGTTLGSALQSNGVLIKKKSSGGGGGGGGTTTIPTVETTLTEVIPIVENKNNCKPGDIFDSTTGLKCPTSNEIPQGCTPYTLFSPLTGIKCPIITTTTIPITTNTIFTRTLKQGMQGDDVKALQVYLNTHGYPIALYNLGSLGKETTSFGSLTKKAVIKFQTANKLTPDGVVGKMTRERMK